MPALDPVVVWTGRGPGARLLRTMLVPFSWGFAAGVAVRNRLFDLGVLATRAAAVPALSVGNLSVGGTGKTPVAADLARRLREGGGHPGVVLRGYGDDEPAVHAVLNPDVPVITNPDRVVGSAEARARGCDVVVLDDAFQHRRVARVADVVLVAAEQWRWPHRLLPAGPNREPLSSLARASLVIVTRKSASRHEGEACAAALSRITRAPVVQVALALDGLVRVSGGEGRGHAASGMALATPSPGGRLPLDRLRGARVLAIAGVGAPSAFGRQLEAAGANVELVSFPDHHRFSGDDVRMLGRRATEDRLVVCTLKDAVKLAAHWPRDLSPLWYVSQRLTLEAGEDAYAACVRRVLDARTGHS